MLFSFFMKVATKESAHNSLITLSAIQFPFNKVTGVHNVQLFLLSKLCSLLITEKNFVIIENNLLCLISLITTQWISKIIIINPIEA